MIVRGICCGFEPDENGYQVERQGVRISSSLKMYYQELDDNHVVGKILKMWVEDTGVWFEAEMDDNDIEMLDKLCPCAYGRVLNKCGKQVREFLCDGVRIINRTADTKARFKSYKIANDWIEVITK